MPSGFEFGFSLGALGVLVVSGHIAFPPPRLQVRAYFKDCFPQFLHRIVTVPEHETDRITAEFFRQKKLKKVIDSRLVWE